MRVLLSGLFVGQKGPHLLFFLKILSVDSSYYFKIEIFRLSYKKGPYYRIWKLGISNKKLQPADLKLQTAKIANELLEWIKVSQF